MLSTVYRIDQIGTSVLDRSTIRLLVPWKRSLLLYLRVDARAGGTRPGGQLFIIILNGWFVFLFFTRDNNDLHPKHTQYSTYVIFILMLILVVCWAESKHPACVSQKSTQADGRRGFAGGKKCAIRISGHEPDSRIKHTTDPWNDETCNTGYCEITTTTPSTTTPTVTNLKLSDGLVGLLNSEVTLFFCNCEHKRA